jgi:hypothetical protein
MSTMRPLMVAGPMLRNLRPARVAELSIGGCWASGAGAAASVHKSKIPKETRPLFMMVDVIKLP